jgi:S-DNA-T family DNA segregation ATPase FtsK/SpoIIIE
MAARLKRRKSIRRKPVANPKKQMDVITDYLSTIAQEEQIRIRPLWLILFSYDSIK